MELAVGTKVRMTRAYRKKLRALGRRKPRWLYNGAKQHVREFGRCIGIVEGPADYNNCKPGHPDYDPSKTGPEVNVRWYPKGSDHGLRYMYDISELEIVR